jgi:hypothetical protein
MADFNVNKEVTSKLRFSPDEADGNLCRGKLVGVEVVEHEINKVKENGELSTWEFAGLTIPTLVFHFEQQKKSTLDKDRYYDHNERVIGNLKSEANGGGNIEVGTLDKIYESMWSRVKHLHDCFAGLPNYLPLSKEVDEAGKKLYANYANANKTAESTIKAFTIFFKAIAIAFNAAKDGKAIYVVADIPAICWMKLVTDYSSKKFLAFPTFVSTGFIELYREKAKPSISFQPSETVILGSSVKSIAPSTPNAGDDLPDDVKKALGIM